mgnify:CR=1 FL=1|tara:strand:+ start:8194 stop:9186 length:993 start_codon:yes stop_codon:yes gene_type:complete
MKKIYTILLSMTLIMALNAQTAIEFDGVDDYIDFGSNSTFNITGNITVEAKVKFSGNVLDWMPIASNYEEDGNSIYNGYWLGTDDVGYAAWFIGDGSVPQDGYYLYSNDSLNDGNWHHLAGVFNGDSAWLYVDGILDTAAQLPNASLNSATDFTVGTDFDALFYNGSVDAVRVWNAERSALDIFNYKDSCLTGNETDLVALYNFELGTGSLNVSDLTAGMNDGVLTNMDAVTIWVTGIDCFIQTSTGVKEKKSDNQISIYPNPNQGNVNLYLENLKDVLVRVYNYQGNLVYKAEQINTATYQFNLDGPAGLYLIEINSKGKSQHYKLIKK